jgi:hypothetical protein
MTAGPYSAGSMVVVINSSFTNIFPSRPQAVTAHFERDEKYLTSDGETVDQSNFTVNV